MVHSMMPNEFFLVNKYFSHLLHFNFMVQPMMSDEISLEKNRLSHLQHMMLRHFPFRQKTFLTFTALRVHGTPHDV